MAIENPIPSPSPRSVIFKGSLLLAFIAIIVAICIFFDPDTQGSEAGVVMDLPVKIGGFTGVDQPISEGERVLLPKDTEFAKKLYTGNVGENIFCQIVLSGLESRSIHRPEICLKGQGWNVRSGEVVSVPLKSGATLKAMVLNITRPTNLAKGPREQEALYAYWFVSRDAETPYHFERIARSNLDLLLHNKSHRWAYVIVMAPVTKGFMPGGKDAAETLEMIKSFIRESVPYFEKSEMKEAPATAMGAVTAAGT